MTRPTAVLILAVAATLGSIAQAAEPPKVDAAPPGAPTEPRSEVRSESRSETRPDGKAEAQPPCITAKTVTRWEPIDGWRALLHAGDKPLAFVDLNVFQGGPYFARNGEPTVRLFAARLCVGDLVQVNGRRGRVVNFEFVRAN